MSKSKEKVYVKTRKVKCSGDESNGTGHPLVYLAIKDKEIVCPYCSKVFILD